MATTTQTQKRSIPGYRVCRNELAEFTNTPGEPVMVRAWTHDDDCIAHFTIEEAVEYGIIRATRS